MPERTLGIKRSYKSHACPPRPPANHRGSAYAQKAKKCLILFAFFFFIFLAAPKSYGSSQAKDQIWAEAVTYATAAATSDPQPTASS